MNRLEVRAWVALAVFATVLVLAFSLWPSADASQEPKVRYIECSHGVHVWLYGDDGIAILPAGGDCK